MINLITISAPSGSGKTTLLKLCYGALIPTAGHLRIFGEDVAMLGRDDVAMARRKIGVVHQDCQFLDHLSVLDNVALPLQVSDQDTAEAMADIGELMSWVGLTNRAHALPPELSGGERQRAALARAVIMSPDVILADEPTGNLDSANVRHIVELLHKVNADRDMTVVLVTHDTELASSADVMLQMRDGEVEQVTPERPPEVTR